MNTSRLTKAAAASAAAAAEKANELLAEAQRVAAPVVRDASKRTADYASKTLDGWEPTIRDALAKVPPAVESAHDKIADEILPSLQQSLHKAAGHAPKVVKKKRCKKVRSFAKFLVLASLVAGAVAAIRHFLTPKDDGWTAHEPSRAYINNNDTFATAAKFNEPAAPRPSAPAAPAEAATEAPAEPLVDAPAAGSYVGPNPPEGYIIKGNDRSKKYHLPGTRGYELTIPEVWFNSEEAAQAAGYTKAQR